MFWEGKMKAGKSRHVTLHEARAVFVEIAKVR